MKYGYIRFARRVTSWDGSLSAAEVQETEFRKANGEPDLSFSVYEIALHHSALVQTLCEHATRFEPKASTVAIDTRTWYCAPDKTPGATGFANADSSHREYRFRTQTHLIWFIRWLLLQRRKRTKQIQKADLVQYIKQQHAAGDQQWIMHVAKTDCEKWIRKAVPKT